MPGATAGSEVNLVDVDTSLVRALGLECPRRDQLVHLGVVAERPHQRRARRRCAGEYRQMGHPASGALVATALEHGRQLVLVPGEKAVIEHEAADARSGAISGHARSLLPRVPHPRHRTLADHDVRPRVKIGSAREASGKRRDRVRKEELLVVVTGVDDANDLLRVVRRGTTERLGAARAGSSTRQGHPERSARPAVAREAMSSFVLEPDVRAGRKRRWRTVAVVGGTGARPAEMAVHAAPQTQAAVVRQDPAVLHHPHAVELSAHADRIRAAAVDAHNRAVVGRHHDQRLLHQPHVGKEIWPEIDGHRGVAQHDRRLARHLENGVIVIGTSRSNVHAGRKGAFQADAADRMRRGCGHGARHLPLTSVRTRTPHGQLGLRGSRYVDDVEAFEGGREPVQEILGIVGGDVGLELLIACRRCSPGELLEQPPDSITDGCRRQGDPADVLRFTPPTRQTVPPPARDDSRQRIEATLVPRDALLKELLHRLEPSHPSESILGSLFAVRQAQDALCTSARERGDEVVALRRVRLDHALPLLWIHRRHQEPSEIDGAVRRSHVLPIDERDLSVGRCACVAKRGVSLDERASWCFSLSALESRHPSHDARYEPLNRRRHVCVPEGATSSGNDGSVLARHRRLVRFGSWWVSADLALVSPRASAGYGGRPTGGPGSTPSPLWSKPPSIGGTFAPASRTPTPSRQSPSRHVTPTARTWWSRWPSPTGRAATRRTRSGAGTARGRCGCSTTPPTSEPCSWSAAGRAPPSPRPSPMRPSRWRSGCSPDF